MRLHLTIGISPLVDISVSQLRNITTDTNS